MNGNELANILKYPGGEWRAGELLPEEWWKKDFPYGQAESMGYRMSPEEIRSRKRREKSISEQMADILRSKDFMMLNAADRMKVMETVRKIQEAEAKGKREREKHETEMLEIGRQTQMQAKVKAILESDRVPAQKVTALTVAGIPLTDARDMVWGKRAPGEEAGRAGREAAPTARAEPTGEELVGGLRPEKRGVQFRMVGGELIKERAGIWEEERLTPEQRIAKREEERKGAEYYRGLAVKREHPEMFVPLEERKFVEEKKQWTKEFGAERADAMFDQAMRTLEYDADVADAERKHKLNVEKFGEEKADNMRTYQLDRLEEERALKESLFDMGFKDKEFIEKKAQWWADLYKTKEDKKEEARQFNITEDRLIKEEANRVKEFKEELKKQYKDLDLDVKKHGLNREIEARIAKTALWNFVLDWQEFGHKGALLKWEKEKTKKEYWWKEKAVGLKNLQAFTSFMGAMDKIIGNAKTSDNLWQLVNKVLGDSLGEDYVNLIGALNKEGKAQMEIPEEFSVALDTLATGKKDKVMEILGVAYNTKTGKWHIPNQSRMGDISAFFLGDPEIEPKELNLDELGCNLSLEEFVDKVSQEPFWSDADKGAVIRMRTDEDLWRGIASKADEKGVLKPPEGEEIKGGRTWDPRTWFRGLFKGKKKEEVNFAVVKTHIDMLYDRTKSMAEVKRYLKEDVGITLDEYKEWLRGTK